METLGSRVYIELDVYEGRKVVYLFFEEAAKIESSQIHLLNLYNKIHIKQDFVTIAKNESDEILLKILYQFKIRASRFFKGLIISLKRTTPSCNTIIILG